MTAAPAALAALAALLLAAPALHAAGDAGRGEQAYEARCGGCHALAEHRVGPRHAGLPGRRAGTEPGYEYSPALRASGIVWDAAMLERWLADPEALVPGQRMGYRIGDAALRADLVAWLMTLR